MKVFESLSASIIKLKKLEDLSLDFGLLKHQQRLLISGKNLTDKIRTHSLTDDGLSDASLKFAKLKDLKTFSLTLRG